MKGWCIPVLGAKPIDDIRAGVTSFSYSIRLKMRGAGQWRIRPLPILKSGDPKLIAQVQQGEVAVSAAADQVKEKKPREMKPAKTPLDRFEDARDKLELPDQEPWLKSNATI